MNQIASPLYPYTQPPPPYSYSATSSAPSSSGTTAMSQPSDPRPPAAVSKFEPAATNGRQSLPSIHEALGAEAHLPNSVPPPPTPAAPQAHTPSIDILRRPPPPEPIQVPPQSSPYVDFRARTATTSQPYQPSPDTRTAYPNVHNPAPPDPFRPSQPRQTSPTPSSAPYSYPPRTAPSEPSPNSATTPRSQFSYGYSQYTPQSSYYGQAVPPHGAPQHHPPPWKAESEVISRVEQRKSTGRTGGSTYGESVKRHLETFDFDHSLGEIDVNAKALLDFTGEYAARAHAHSRTGLGPGSTPGLSQVEELIKKGQVIQQSLNRIRDVVIEQQNAIAEQEQSRAYQSQRREYESVEEKAAYLNGGDDAKGGFGGGDAKKRRGRAAPPGRCHSCNRAETPEWRRGPDGARTLCNACGLHYAKLTRKMGNNKVAVGSSNLRPKSLMPGENGP